MMYECKQSTKAIQRTCFTREVLISVGERVKFKYYTKQYVVIEYPNEEGLQTRTRVSFFDWSNNFEQV